MNEHLETNLGQDQESIESYINHVCERGMMLIRNGLWDGIDLFRYKGWWKNFEGMKERLLAALLVDRLIYRSEEHMKSMLFDLLTVAVPNCMRLCGDKDYAKNRKLLTKLCENGDNGIRLVNINEQDQPSQSSGEIVNFVNHYMNVRRKNIIYQHNVVRDYENGARIFILVDDIICTGVQIKTALDGIMPERMEDARFYVAVCCACKEGIENIKKIYPHVGIAYTELLDENHAFFNSLEYEKIPFENKDKLRDYYEEYALKKKFEKKGLYGKNDMALVYAFQNSTPNASLPILYWKNKVFHQFLNKRGS